MIYQTNAIFLHSIKYSETSLIIKVYTELYGVKSYLLKGAYRKKSLFKANTLQPMCNLNIVAYTNNKSQLHTVKEISSINLFSKSYSNIYKSSILFFLNEMIYNCVREGELNTDLYAYIKDSLFQLEEMEENYFNFHLVFLLELCAFLGIQPQNNYNANNRFFNIQEGYFDNMIKPGNTISNENINKVFSKLLNINLKTLSYVDISSSERRELIILLIHYYKSHISGFKEVKSHKILETILS